MNIEKIEINGYYVWVDKDAEIKEGDYFHYKHFGEHIIDKVNDLTDLFNLNNDDNYFNKIIAASPELNLEGIKTCNHKIWEAFEIVDNSCNPGEYEYWLFEKGYQTAERELFTEDDVRKVIEIVHEWYNSRPYFLSTEQIIEELKQSKV